MSPYYFFSCSIIFILSLLHSFSSVMLSFCCSNSYFRFYAFTMSLSRLDCDAGGFQLPRPFSCVSVLYGCVSVLSHSLDIHCSHLWRQPHVALINIATLINPWLYIDKDLTGPDYKTCNAVMRLSAPKLDV